MIWCLWCVIWYATEWCGGCGWEKITHTGSHLSHCGVKPDQVKGRKRNMKRETWTGYVNQRSFVVCECVVLPSEWIVSRANVTSESPVRRELKCEKERRKRLWLINPPSLKIFCFYLSATGMKWRSVRRRRRDDFTGGENWSQRVSSLGLQTHTQTHKNLFADQWMFVRREKNGREWDRN